MPVLTYTLMLLAVILVAGATIWLLSLGGPAVMLFALPVFLIATATFRWVRK